MLVFSIQKSDSVRYLDCRYTSGHETDSGSGPCFRSMVGAKPEPPGFTSQQGRGSLAVGGARVRSGGDSCSRDLVSGWSGVGGVPRSRGLFLVPLSSAFSPKSSQLRYQPVSCSSGDSHSSFLSLFLNKLTIALDSLFIMKPY